MKLKMYKELGVALQLIYTSPLCSRLHGNHNYLQAFIHGIAFALNLVHNSFATPGMPWLAKIAKIALASRPASLRGYRRAVETTYGMKTTADVLE
jgi:hypothetical protein